MSDRRCRAVWLLIALLLLPPGRRAAAQPPASGSPALAGQPDWLEARGLSLVYLVGQLPEDLLRGTILVYGDNNGLVVYESGVRTGDRVVVTTTIYPRVYEASWAPNHQLTQFPCLGQKPIFDHLGGAMTESVLRIYTPAGVDITSQIQFMYLNRAGMSQPLAGSLEYDRYPVDAYGARKPFLLPIEPDGLHIPPNSGCNIQIPGQDYYPLTGVFTIEHVPAIQGTIVASQAATFQSYIGIGQFGIFAPLMQQLRSRYGDRHGRIPLEIPAGASHFLLKFPAMPVDPFADQSQSGYRNAGRPTGGTYRLSGDGHLSVDLTYSAVFPLGAVWRDQDQAPGAEFLPRIEHPGDLAPPEQIIPTGIAYDPCFTQGTCSGAILQRIYDVVMPLEIVYVSIEGQAAGAWVPLKQAGPAWTPGAGGSLREAKGAPLTTGAGARLVPARRYFLYFPFVASAPRESPPGDCPCGWFDPQGQMLDYDPVP